MRNSPVTSPPEPIGGVEWQVNAKLPSDLTAGTHRARVRTSRSPFCESGEFRLEGEGRRAGLFSSHFQETSLGFRPADSVYRKDRSLWSRLRSEGADAVVQIVRQRAGSFARVHDGQALLAGDGHFGADLVDIAAFEARQRPAVAEVLFHQL